MSAEWSVEANPDRYRRLLAILFKRDEADERAPDMEEGEAA
ncbi:hypothetical protein SMD20_34070 [Nonomuraea sp. LP-02]|nr:hypothetical protein [Nonomuraea sp. LP-02]MED7929315.1 hypothetical protein [Nonomuraea sp. LP-02]